MMSARYFQSNDIVHFKGHTITTINFHTWVSDYVLIYSVNFLINLWPNPTNRTSFNLDALGSNSHQYVSYQKGDAVIINKLQFKINRIC